MPSITLNRKRTVLLGGSRWHQILALVLLVIGLASSLSATAQEYPSKPIRIVVPLSPGGGVDRMARILAEQLQAKWGQSVTVENRAGAGGNIGADYVAKSAPDGYTLLVTAQGPLVSNKHFYPNLSFDPDTLTPVSAISDTVLVLITPPNRKFDSLQKLIAHAKANPNQLNYASSGNGTTLHLAAEMFKSMTGTKITHIPYKGSAPAATDVLGGQVDMMFAEYGMAQKLIRAAKVRGLAITDQKRNPSFPDIPALSEVLPGYDYTVWIGMVAPPGTPSAIANKLSSAIAEILKQPDVSKQLQDVGVKTIGSTPAEMASRMKRERTQWSDLIRTIGTKAD